MLYVVSVFFLCFGSDCKGQRLPASEEWIEKCKKKDSYLWHCLRKARDYYKCEFIVDDDIKTRDDDVEGFIENFNERAGDLQKWECICFLIDCYTWDLSNPSVSIKAAMTNVQSIRPEIERHGNFFNFKKQYPSFRRWMTQTFKLNPEKLEKDVRYFLKMYTVILDTKRESGFRLTFPDVYTVVNLGLTKCNSNSPAEGFSFITDTYKNPHEFNKSQVILNAEVVCTINCLALQDVKPFLKRSLKVLHSIGVYSADAPRSAHTLPAAVRQMERGEYVVGEDDEKLSKHKFRHNQRLRNDDIKKQIFKNSDSKLKQALEEQDREKRKLWLKERAISDVILTTPSRSRRLSALRTRSRSRSRRPMRRRSSNNKNSSNKPAILGRVRRMQLSGGRGGAASNILSMNVKEAFQSVKERSKSVARMISRRREGEEGSSDGNSGDNKNDETGSMSVSRDEGDEGDELIAESALVTPEKQKRVKSGKEELST